jgi:hypothetical protein
MPEYIYREMGPDERELDWRITRTVMRDPVLMRTLQDSQSGGQKHAIVALVENGTLVEAYVSPQKAVEEKFPFGAVRQAFEYYTTDGGVCLVIVRDNKVVVSLNGLLGRN